MDLSKIGEVIGIGPDDFTSARIAASAATIEKPVEALGVLADQVDAVLGGVDDTTTAEQAELIEALVALVNEGLPARIEADTKLAERLEALRASKVAKPAVETVKAETVEAETVVAPAAVVLDTPTPDTVSASKWVRADGGNLFATDGARISEQEAVAAFTRAVSAGAVNSRTPVVRFEAGSTLRAGDAGYGDAKQQVSRISAACSTTDPCVSIGSCRAPQLLDDVLVCGSSDWLEAGSFNSFDWNGGPVSRRKATTDTVGSGRWTTADYCALFVQDGNGNVVLDANGQPTFLTGAALDAQLKNCGVATCSGVETFDPSFDYACLTVPADLDEAVAAAYLEVLGNRLVRQQAQGALGYLLSKAIAVIPTGVPTGNYLAAIIHTLNQIVQPIKNDTSYAGNGVTVWVPAWMLAVLTEENAFSETNVVTSLNEWASANQVTFASSRDSFEASAFAPWALAGYSDWNWAAPTGGVAGDPSTPATGVPAPVNFPIIAAETGSVYFAAMPFIDFGPAPAGKDDLRQNTRTIFAERKSLMMTSGCTPIYAARFCADAFGVSYADIAAPASSC